MNRMLLTLTLAFVSLPISLAHADAPITVGVLTPGLKAAADCTVAGGMLAPAAAHKHLRVAVYVGPGASEGRSVAIDALAKDPDLTVDSISPEDIRAGKLAGYDVLLQPGGSGSKQGKALEAPGRDKIREFVRGGGGYLGICGGSYLASDDYEWSLGIINTRVLDKAHWARGHGPVDVTPTDTGKDLLGAKADHLTIIYWQGPIMAPKNDPKLPKYVELAKFNGEVTREDVPGGVMPGTTAIAAAPFGQGRVICFSPHPEKTPGQESLLHHAVVWVASGSNGALTKANAPVAAAAGKN